MSGIPQPSRELDALLAERVFGLEVALRGIWANGYDDYGHDEGVDIPTDDDIEFDKAYTLENPYHEKLSYKLETRAEDYAYCHRWSEDLKSHAWLRVPHYSTDVKHLDGLLEKLWTCGLVSLSNIANGSDAQYRLDYTPTPAFTSDAAQENLGSSAHVEGVSRLHAVCLALLVASGNLEVPHDSI